MGKKGFLDRILFAVLVLCLVTEYQAANTTVTVAGTTTAPARTTSRQPTTLSNTITPGHVPTAEKTSKLTTSTSTKLTTSTTTSKPPLAKTSDAKTSTAPSSVPTTTKATSTSTTPTPSTTTSPAKTSDTKTSTTLSTTTSVPTTARTADVTTSSSTTTTTPTNKPVATTKTATAPTSTAGATGAPTRPVSTGSNAAGKGASSSSTTSKPGSKSSTSSTASSSTATATVTTPTTTADACLRVDCKNAGSCQVAGGTATCNCTATGYSGDQCQTDVDECTESKFTCPDHSSCNNTAGGYTCPCNHGYRENSGNCTDIDECSDQSLNNCDQSANCSNTAGSFVCKCKAGFSGNGTTCNDIDECEKATFSCPGHTHCLNALGSYTCPCDDGYRLSNRTCTDIDECSDQSLNDCDQYANCSNINGSFLCSCKAGFSGNGTTCNDVDECKNASLFNCSMHASCHNLVGGYNCTCDSGFRRDDEECIDIDECSEDLDNCNKYANCTNTVGSFNCSCFDGFKGNGTDCEDADTCSNTSCKNGGHCLELAGFNYCYCEEGWSGQHCEIDVDECNRSSVCPKGAICRNINGSYNCSCPDGYRRNWMFECIEEVLVPIGQQPSTLKVDKPVTHVITNRPIPYLGKQYRQVFINQNGVISLGREIPNRYPPSDLSSLPTTTPVIAPLWTAIDTTVTNSSSVSISQSNTSNEALQKLVSNGKAGFAPTYTLSVTWKGVSPFNASSEEMVNFQAILTTDGNSTFIVFNYDQEFFTWVANQWRPVTIGYTSGAGFKQIFNSSNFMDAKSSTNDAEIDYMCGQLINAGTTGRWLFDVTSPNDDPIALAKTQCRQWAEDKSISSRIVNARVNSAPCPCIKAQAINDTRFKSTSSIDGSACYISQTNKPSVTGQEVCCYSRTGSLVTGFPGGGHFQLDKASINITYGYDLCCKSTVDGNTSLCALFYRQSPSRTCKDYRAPKRVLVWGDPHFQTFDGQEYTFNGRGDYMLLDKDNGNLTIQIRMDRRFPNKNETVLTGVVAKIPNLPSIGISFDFQASIWIYENAEFQGVFHPIQGLCPLAAENSISALIACSQYRIKISLPNSGFSLEVLFYKDKTYNKAMNLIVHDQGVPGVFTGLLGNNNGDPGDDFVLRNGTVLAGTASEKEVYVFGDSWYKDKNTKSLFRTKVHFSDTDRQPGRFLSDASNIQSLIKESNCKSFTASELNDTCHSNKACEVDAASTCDKQFGLLSRELQETVNTEQELADNTPPIFVGMPDQLYVSINKTLTLQFNVSDNMDGPEDITWKIETSIQNASYSWDDISRTFTWNVTEAFRSTSLLLYLRVTATDSKGASSTYWPTIRYCGCEEASQCDNSSEGIRKDRSIRDTCICGAHSTGEYCDMAIPLCESNPCFPDVTCNSSETVDDHCGSCPDDLQGNGEVCYDVNECDEDKPCEQMCSNTVGSFQCSCEEGFKLKADGTCEDVNECELGSSCSVFELCENIPGNYSCHCPTGYYEGNSGCAKANAAFVGVLVFKVYSKPSVEEITDQLVTMLNTTGRLLFLEIVEVVPSGRKRRDVNSGLKEEEVTYVAHYLPGTSTTTVQTGVKQYFDDQLPGCALETSCINRVNGFYLDKVQSKVLDDSDRALCGLPGRTTCDAYSTECQVQNGAFHCNCKTGFERLPLVDYRCQDINECNTTRYPGSCVAGTCSNIAGDWLCTCPAGFQLSQQGTNRTCIDMCADNPCNNGGRCEHGAVEGSYICRCDDQWTGAKCEDENAETKKLKTIAIVVGAIVGGVCLLMLFAMLGMYRRHKTKLADMRSVVFNTSNGMSTLMQTSTPGSLASSYGRQTPNRSRDANLEMQERASGSNHLEEADSTKHDETRPLTRLDKETLDGKDNPSFLHGGKTGPSGPKGAKREGNQYEYF